MNRFAANVLHWFLREKGSRSRSMDRPMVEELEPRIVLNAGPVDILPPAAFSAASTHRFCPLTRARPHLR